MFKLEGWPIHFCKIENKEREEAADVDGDCGACRSHIALLADSGLLTGLKWSLLCSFKVKDSGEAREGAT